jgi:hypothetical protein
LAVHTLPPAARRLVAAIWFAAFALLFTMLFFLRLSMASHAVILYIVLPSFAAGIAGHIWGGAILDSSHVRTYRQSVLRGLVVSAGAYAIFAVLYASVLPMLEGQWSLGRVGSLFLFTLMLGILTGGPLAAVSGMIAGITLFRVSRHLFAESDDRTSEVALSRHQTRAPGESHRINRD